MRRWLDSSLLSITLAGVAAGGEPVDLRGAPADVRGACADARGAPADTRGAPADTRIEAIRGRVRLVSGEGQGALLLPGIAVGAERAARLEVGAGAEVAVHWSGVASLRLLGPGELAWTELAGRGRLACELVEVGQAFFEVRSGRPTIELPSGWVLDLDRGAARIQTHPGGASEIENTAGSPIRLTRHPDPFLVPERWLAPGERVHLASGPVRRARPGGDVRPPPWSTVGWPFGDSHAAETAKSAAAPEPNLAGPPVDEPRDPPVLEPRPEPTALIEPGTTIDPGVPPEIEHLPGVRPPEPAAPFDPELWRGLPAAELGRFGAVVFERSAFAIGYDRFGRSKFTLREGHPRSAFCLANGRDIELMPGAVGIFDAAGNLVAHVGRIRVHAAPPGRPEAQDAGLAGFEPGAEDAAPPAAADHASPGSTPPRK